MLIPVQKPNDIVEIAGRKCVILQHKGAEKYLVMDVNGVGKREFDDNNNQYENSNIDQYLNIEYYNSLSFKDAIVEQKIQQSFYSYAWSNPNYIWVGGANTAPGCKGDPCIKQPDGSWLSWDKHIAIKGQPGMHRFKNRGTKHIDGLNTNIISRKIYLPSVSEISLIANLNDQYDMDRFLRNSSGYFLHIWLRDGNFDDARIVVGSSHDKSLGTIEAQGNGQVTVRPTFVIDLSKVEYTNLNQQFIK